MLDTIAICPFLSVACCSPGQATFTFASCIAPASQLLWVLWLHLYSAGLQGPTSLPDAPYSQAALIPLHDGISLLIFKLDGGDSHTTCTNMLIHSFNRYQLSTSWDTTVVKPAKTLPSQS